MTLENSAVILLYLLLKMTLEFPSPFSVIFYEKTLEISTVILRDCLVKNLIKFDKYCKVDKCSGKIFFFLSKYCKLDKSFGRKVEIHQQYLRCGAKTAQISIWKKITAKHIIFTRTGRF